MANPCYNSSQVNDLPNILDQYRGASQGRFAKPLLAETRFKLQSPQDRMN
jgi:hypothetical protein